MPVNNGLHSRYDPNLTKAPVVYYNRLKTVLPAHYDLHGAARRYYFKAGWKFFHRLNIHLNNLSRLYRWAPVLHLKSPR